MYLPKDPKAQFSEDGFEMSMAVNHLGHFLLCNLLLEDMAKAKDPRMIIVGSITGQLISPSLPQSACPSVRLHKYKFWAA